MSSSKFVRSVKQPDIKDILQKKKDKQVKATPTASKPSAKKRTPPSSERPNSKKYQCSAITMESVSNSNHVNKTNSGESDEPFNTKLKGFSQEFVEFGKTMIEFLQPMCDDIKSLVESNKQTSLSLLESRKQTETTNKLCKQVIIEQSELKQRCERVESENMELKMRLQKLENKMLQNNLIIHGIKEDEWQLDDNRREKIHKAISHTVDDSDSRKSLKIARSIPIVKSECLGKYRMGKPRPISVCFEKKSHAETLFQSKKSLPKDIYINCEYTADTEHSRKILRPILKLAKSKPEYKGKCKLDGDVLVVHGRRYTTNSLHHLPKDINGYRASSKENDGTIAFFSELNPMSNFHPAYFENDGVHYHCSEQFIQEQKALYFEDHDIAHQIRNAKSALDYKDLAKTIRGYNHAAWCEVAKDKCKPGIRAKFTYPVNGHLRNLLLTTGSKQIVEVCYDQLWGTGIPLKESDCLKEDRWTNVGILGEILMEIRGEITSTTNPAMDPIVAQMET